MQIAYTAIQAGHGSRRCIQESRRDLKATVAYIKDPKLPMPKLYPDLLKDQDILDVATYINQDIAR